MVSHLQLAFIHLRLRQLFESTQHSSPFGHINVAVFGDLFQLPPVRGKPMFKRIRHHGAQRACFGISSHHLWRFFDYDELTVNMHQKDDTENYVNMFDRIRLGSPLDSDIQILNEHRIELKASLERVAYKMCELTQTTDLSIVYIMPLNDSVSELCSRNLALVLSRLQVLIPACGKPKVKKKEN
ncbi:uncharacterized protein LOC106879741 [Octopus bimaculoides]|uniref:uncharacterized protein LOC106879741 n=1 Tax=Octopus bimaculoides TaxID=37653 RepID=UPI00071E3350|nr:uncharacterized protein LOC106879741 [Octopus bimaculoides]|eukprot:XP_014784908.1 PREDICTED: uncharacterized protein LOC106879741 [Octopus bimaculoides]